MRGISFREKNPTEVAFCGDDSGKGWGEGGRPGNGYEEK